MSLGAFLTLLANQTAPFNLSRIFSYSTRTYLQNNLHHLQNSA